MKFFQFKKKNLQKYFQKEIKIYEQSTRVITSGKIKSVAVLIEESQINDTLNFEKLKTVLNLSSDKFQILVFKPFVKKQVYAENEIHEKYFSWSGSLKLNKLSEFVKNDYDLLINYGFEENLYWKVITLQSQSKFKVGFSSLDNRLYDLSVSDSDRNMDVLNAETEKYLKILKKL